jgi:hypothetical protein
MKLLNSILAASALAVCTTAAKADFQVQFLTFNAGNPTLGFVTDSDGVTPLGAGFSAQLYAGLNSGSLVAIGSPTPFVNGNQGYISAGTVTASSGTIFGGSVGAYQLKAWDNDGGTITSYEAAVAANRKTGQSAIVGLGGTVQTGGFTFGGVPNGGGAPITPPDVNLHPSFSVVIPEPSTIALGILGLSGLLLRRRRE